MNNDQLQRAERALLDAIQADTWAATRERARTALYLVQTVMAQGEFGSAVDRTLPVGILSGIKVVVDPSMTADQIKAVFRSERQEEFVKLYRDGDVYCTRKSDVAGIAELQSEGWRLANQPSDGDSLAFKYGNALVDRKLDPSYEQQGDGGACDIQMQPYEGLTAEFVDEVARLCDDAPGSRNAVYSALVNCRAVLVPSDGGYKADAEQPSARVALSGDTARLDWLIEHQAWIQWKMRDGSILQCQVWDQDPDEEYHILSGDDRYFDTPRDAIDAAILAASAAQGDSDAG